MQVHSKSRTERSLTNGSGEESIEQVAADRTESRRSFLQRSAVVTATAGTAAMVAGTQSADAGLSPLNILPHLYAGWNARNFSAIRQHENDHVTFLLNVLGSSGFPDPGFVNISMPMRRPLPRPLGSLTIPAWRPTCSLHSSPVPRPGRGRLDRFDRGPSRRLLEHTSQ